jgi:hypothetical protein
MGNNNGNPGIQKVHPIKHGKHRHNGCISRNTHTHGKESVYRLTEFKMQSGNPIRNHRPQKHGNKYGNDRNHYRTDVAVNNICFRYCTDIIYKSQRFRKPPCIRIQFLVAFKGTEDQPDHRIQTHHSEDGH